MLIPVENDAKLAFFCQKYERKWGKFRFLIFFLHERLCISKFFCNFVQ